VSYNFYRKDTQMNRAALALVAALAACATTDPPQSQMASAREMVAQARAAAEQAPPPELYLAQGKLDQAERAMQRRHYEHARLLAEQAEADARLAWVTTEKTRAERALASEKASR
jgi:Domain of unknown function (DUF4398)